MLDQLRIELAALKAWNTQDFPFENCAKLEAVAHRIIRMADIIRKMREIVERN